jgi:hypothetical protein
MTKSEGRKIATVETGIQTEAFKLFRLDSSNNERKKGKCFLSKIAM